MQKSEAVVDTAGGTNYAGKGGIECYSRGRAEAGVTDVQYMGEGRGQSGHIGTGGEPRELRRIRSDVKASE